MSDHTPTFADVCHAIAEGRVASTIEGAVYRVNALELRRYLNKNRLLAFISTAPGSSTRSGSLCRSLPNSHLFA